MMEITTRKYLRVRNERKEGRNINFCSSDKPNLGKKRKNIPIGILSLLPNESDYSATRKKLQAALFETITAIKSDRRVRVGRLNSARIPT